MAVLMFTNTYRKEFKAAAVNSLSLSLSLSLFSPRKTLTKKTPFIIVKER